CITRMLKVNNSLDHNSCDSAHGAVQSLSNDRSAQDHVARGIGGSDRRGRDGLDKQRCSNCPGKHGVEPRCYGNVSSSEKLATQLPPCCGNSVTTLISTSVPAFISKG